MALPPSAEFIGHNYDEAIRLAHEALRQRSDFVGGHRVLTAAAAWPDKHEAAAYSELGAAAQCHAGLDRKRAANEEPVADREHYLEGLRRAGFGVAFTRARGLDD